MVFWVGRRADGVDRVVCERQVIDERSSSKYSRIMSDQGQTAVSNSSAKKTASSFATVALQNLHLDPNNYRFIDDENYKDISTDKYLSEQVQQRTMKFILGDNAEGVKDLIDSFLNSGWLPVDQIQAKHIKNDHYLVVEGNRRVAALKLLEQRYREKHIDLEGLDPAIFEAVPVVIYPEADEMHNLIVMGLSHISGKKKWPTINQAQLMKTLREKHQMRPEAICKALSISRREYNLSQKTLIIVDLYKQSEYGDKFRSDQYNIFREIVNTPRLRDWIGWDETKWVVKEVGKLHRIFALVSDAESDDDDDGHGVPYEPAITTGAQMRELGKIIDDDDAFAVLESTRSLSQAIMGAGTLTKNQIERAIEMSDTGANTLFGHIKYVTDGDIEKAAEVGKKMLSLATLKNKKMTISVGNEVVERESIHLTHRDDFQSFTQLELTNYKAHKDLVLTGLGRVNIFAGPNNAGKTSVLEAIYLLTQQSEVQGLLDMVSRRGKLRQDPVPRLLYELIPQTIKISGTFDRVLASIESDLDKDSDAVGDKNGYIGSVLMKSSYGEYAQSSETHFFAKRELQRVYSKNPRILCRSILSSPFSMHDPSVLARVYERAVEKGCKDKVLDFLRKWVDTDLKNIELANEFQRFWVSHQDPSRNLDLTHFGEGMQRVFMIALVFADAENGVVLIDELENALHTSLLLDFSRFLHELAIAFRVQVFVTSHSKECIDAFVTNDFRLDEVSTFTLVQRNGQTVSIRRSGPELADLLEIGDVDMRRAR